MPAKWSWPDRVANWRSWQSQVKISENKNSLRTYNCSGYGLMSQSKGKLSAKDETLARVLKLAPWLALVLASVPAPLLFLVLFLTATATDTAAVYLLFAALSLALGLALGLVVALILTIYRRRWLSRLRDKLALDGVTANEVVWFESELTSAERASLAEIESSNPLLA